MRSTRDQPDGSAPAASGISRTIIMNMEQVWTLLSCFFWFQIVFGFLITPGGLQPPISTGPGTYFIIMLMDVWNSRRALADAGEADSALRHGAS
jgi:hypothetical protein